jgi:hypothetical protein
MRRVIPAAIFAAALVATPLAAQQKPAESSAPAKSDASKSVLLSGCLTGGPSSYTLSNVAITRGAHETAPDRPVGTAGESTSYSLIARDAVDLGDYISKRVEVTGTLLPPAPPQAAAAEPKAKQDDSPDVKAQARAEVAAVAYPKVAATAVKLLSATCQ